MKRPEAVRFLKGLGLNTKLTLLATLVIVSASAVTVHFSLSYFMEHMRRGVAKDQFALVHIVGSELDDKIATAQRELCAVADSLPPTIVRDAAALQRFLESRRDLAVFFSGGAAYLSPTGTVTAVSLPGDRTLLGRDLSYRPYFLETVRTGKPYICDPYISTNDGHPSVMFTVPVSDRGGRLAGVLCGRIDLLASNILDSVLHQRPEDGRHFFLFNGDGQIIVHRDLRKISQDRNRPLLERFRRARQGSIESTGECGVPMLSSFTPLASTGWIVAAEAPLAELYAPTLQTKRLVLGTLALVLVCSLSIIFLCVRGLTGPLLFFARRVEEMNDGDGYRPVPIVRQDEIGVLAAAFNRMVVEVAAQQRALEEEKGFSEKLLLNSAVPSFVIDTDFRVIIWNGACEELTGVAAADLLGGSDAWRAFYPQRRPVLAEVVVQGSLWEMADLYDRYSESPLIPDGVRAEGWFRLRGKQHYLSFDAAPIRDSAGRIIAAIQTIQDLTRRKRKEEELKKMVQATAESEERFRRLVELSLDGIALLVGRRFVFINPAGCDLLGSPSPDALLGQPAVGFVERGSLELFAEQLRYVETNRQSSPWLEQRLVRVDRSTLEVELGVSPFVFEGKEALQVIFRDITERKLAKARLETLAHYDSLTELPNRVLFFDRLYHAVEESKRHDYPLALLFLDLDRFKEINDTLGHHAGDRALVEVGERLRNCVRSCDMVARMGGDEFTVILTKMAAVEDAALVAERILDALEAPLELCGESRTIGASIGICIFPGAARDVAEIMAQADSAMYQVKQSGKNGYCYYGGTLFCPPGGRVRPAGAPPQLRLGGLAR